MGTDARKDRLRPLGVKVRGRSDESAVTAPTTAEREVELSISRPGRPRLVPLLLLAALSALLIGVSPSAGSGGPKGVDVDVEGFVTADGADLAVGGGRWSPVGFNDYRLTSAPGGYVCDANAGPISDHELGARLDRVRAAGGNVVRTWFFGPYVDPDAAAGEWGPLERVVSAAEERGLRVIGVLGNHWADCEGGADEKEIDFYEGGYRSGSGEGRSYLEHAAAVAEHFADSDAIAYWQLLNEPEAPGPMGCSASEATAALAGFASEATTVVRKADPNHLVSLGVTGGDQCGVAGESYEVIQADVDICELHLYDSADTGTDPADPLPHVAAQRIAACEAAGKPVVAGELGFAPDLDRHGDPTGDVTRGTLVNRAGFLDARLEAMRGAGLDGFLVWQMTGDSPDPTEPDPFGVGPCDPLEQVVAAWAGADPSSVACDDNGPSLAGVGP